MKKVFIHYSPFHTGQKTKHVAFSRNGYNWHLFLGQVTAVVSGLNNHKLWFKHFEIHKQKKKTFPLLPVTHQKKNITERVPRLLPVRN